MPDSILVIGGGVAGIHVALNAAEYGTKVYLIDDTASIGGIMARLDKTFPTNDCSICIEAPRMYEVDNHENIEILTNTEVRRIAKKDGGFAVRLVRKAKYIDEDKCTGCGACSQACPVSVPDEMDGKIGGTHKLIHMAFPQAVPSTVAVDTACRNGKMRTDGACIGGCVVDCSQCRECPIALCVKACAKEGKNAVLLWQTDRMMDIEVKSIVVAAGLSPDEPETGQYGYGVYENVITNVQFERLMNAGGPTGGEIIRPSDKEHPKKIGWIQCVGRGLREGEIPYCSKVCCMIAAKQTIITKEHGSDVDAVVFHNDLKAYGKGFWGFYRKAVEHHVRYIRSRPFDVREDAVTKNITVRYEDLDTGKINEEEVEMLVLSMGLAPGGRNKKLAKALGVELDKYGFFKEKDPLLSPMETNVEGVYVCGGATGPIDISESVIQAFAAGLKAVSGRTGGKI
jgi:heterodisulfide reductase subunit A2